MRIAGVVLTFSFALTTGQWLHDLVHDWTGVVLSLASFRSLFNSRPTSCYSLYLIIGIIDLITRVTFGPFTDTIIRHESFIYSPPIEFIRPESRASLPSLCR